MEANAFVPQPVFDMRSETPVSTAFDDVYFSREGGIAETSHVFLKGNGLPERWRDRRHFTIGELGFGTGLNFLVTLKTFRATAAKGACLNYIALEKFPFTAERLQPVLALQPELAAEAAELLAAYPLRLPGLHRLNLGNVRLTLCLGEAEDMLRQWTCRVDAWFLDGFSPAKNAAMWSPSVLSQVGCLSAPDATVATFTAAGAVKRGLQEVRFAVRKVPGFAHKREMLVGEKAAMMPLPASSGTPRSCGIVIGAGIAGATLARALAERGMKVTVLERGAVAGGASGNEAGVLFPPLTKQWNISAAWYFTAYGFALRQLAAWQRQGLDFSLGAPGMLRLPRSMEEEEQLRRLNETLGLDPAIVHWLERDAASAQAGIELKTGAAFFPDGTWISPPELCRALLQHERIVVRDHSAAISLRSLGNGWQATLADDETLDAAQLAVTCAEETAALLPGYKLRLGTVGGQVSIFPATDVATPLRSILCRKGYAIPLRDRYLIGATYHRDALLEVKEPRHQENMAELENILPGWFKGNAVDGRSSVRATTPDRMPYVGSLDKGLYVSAGHGSRGLLSAPLAAEVIAGMMTGEPVPLTSDLLRAIDPGRFRAH